MITSLRVRAERAHRNDRLFLGIVYGSASLFILLIGALFIQLVMGSWLSIRTFGLAFLWTSQWNPVTSQFGALPLIFGTVVSSLIAIVLAGIIGILAAAFLS